MLPASRPLYRAAALGIFHLTIGLFLVIYSTHISCYFHCVSHSTLIKCISAVLRHNPIIQSSKHHISTHMYSTASIVPLFMGSPEISHAPPPPSNCLFPHFTTEPFISASLPITPSLKPQNTPAGKRCWTNALRNELINHRATNVIETWLI